MVPIVAVIGKSNSGKTTLIEKIITELKARDYRVATAKNVSHKLAFDKPGKDSWRHIQAGSEAVAVSSSDNIVLIKPVKGNVNLDEIVHLLSEDYDIIIAEGFKQSNVPKIEVHRKEIGPPLIAVRKLIAIATDEPLETEVRQFDLQDVKGLVDLLENDYIKPQREDIAIYVNSNPVPLSAFPEDIVNDILVAVSPGLKGVNTIRNLEIFISKKSRQ